MEGIYNRSHIIQIPRLASRRRDELERALLAARGIEVSAEFSGVPGFAGLPGHAIVEAASSCVCEADFRKRLLHR